jgi:hypothetical protein
MTNYERRVQNIQNRSNMKAKELEDKLVEQYLNDPEVNFKMRSEIDHKISSILDKSNNNFSMLYAHPKLIN